MALFREPLQTSSSRREKATAAGGNAETSRRPCAFVGCHCRSGAISEDRGIRPDLVTKVYVGLDPSLVRAAGLSTLAHLEDLREHGLIVADGSTLGESRFRRA